MEWKRKFAESNGITMHYVEAGDGPLVVLCHGFPESWYSWRHQIMALAKAGFRVIAPDQRGYGQTTAPQAIGDYSIFHLVGDIVGLVQAANESNAVIIGHDWGAPVAWSAAMLRPDIFRAVGLLSVPYMARGPVSPVRALAAAYAPKVFYMAYFQDEGVAERELEQDVRRTMLSFLYSASGESDFPSFGAIEPGHGILSAMRTPKALPAWLTDADLDFFVSEFSRTGFRGGLNWYRNLERNWALTGFQDGAKIEQPSVFIAGQTDPVLVFAAPAFEAMKMTMPKLRKTLVLPGAGHWIQQERPNEVNAALLEFLSGL
ncbi:MAG TPA: alpha/beta hydrolase [Rhizomicrobium sp.]|nr:alpha/beta hydrolase [Rhizomicrobium sp.]